MLEKVKSVRKQLLLSAAISISVLLLASCTASPSTVNGNEPTSHQLRITLLGTESEVPVNSKGEILSNTEVTSLDGLITLSIDKGTTLLDSEQNPVQFMQAIVNPDPPAPPENATIIGPAYDFLPKGIAIDSSIKLTLSYDPAELPDGTREDHIYIARFDGGGWEKLPYKQMDTDNHKVTTRITSLSGYAILVPSEQDGSTPTPEPGPTPGANRVDVVYFHRTNRCYSCQYIEAEIKYTLDTYFIEELNSGKLTFRTVDVQDPANAVIVEKYGAYTSQLFINSVTDNTDHIEHVTELWSYIGNDEAFVSATKNKIAEALEEIS